MNKVVGTRFGSSDLRGRRSSHTMTAMTHMPISKALKVNDNSKEIGFAGMALVFELTVQVGVTMVRPNSGVSPMFR